MHPRGHNQIYFYFLAEQIFKCISTYRDPNSVWKIVQTTEFGTNNLFCSFYKFKKK